MKFLIPILLVAFPFSISVNTVKPFATNYYFSNSGSDAGAGTIGDPWQTIAKFNSVIASASPDDQFLFNRDDEFTGAMAVNRSGSASHPIVIGAYGTGAAPVISGMATVSGWSSVGGGLYEATVSGNPSALNMVTLNGAFQPVGRYPKANTTNAGYKTFQSHTGNSITSSGINGIPSFVGGEVVIRDLHWILMRHTITAQTSTVVSYTGSNYGFGTNDGFGFFFQNHVNACTALGDWAYNGSTHKITMFFGGGGPGGNVVKASNTNDLVTLASRSYITFNGVDLQGSNNSTVNLSGTTNNIVLNSVGIKFSGTDGVYGTTTNISDITLQSCTGDWTNNNFVNSTSSPNWNILDCDINHTGATAGMGKSGDGTYTCIYDVSTNSQVKRCSIQNTGYVAINFSSVNGRGGGVVIQNNFVNTFCFIKDDGAAIYSWGKTNPVPVTQRLIDGNIVLHGGGAGAGAGGSNGQGQGIYMDDRVADVTVSNNTCAYNAGAGIYLHNAMRITISNNTCFGNSEFEIRSMQDDAAAPIRGININGNIFFATTTQLDYQHLVLNFRSTTADISQWGIWDNNYYCRPLTSEQQAMTARQIGTDFFGTLAQWKTFSGKDANSKSTPIAVTDVNRIRFEYNSTASPVTLNFPGTSYMEVSGTVRNGAVTIPANRSWIGIQTTATANVPPTVTTGGNQVTTLPKDTVNVTSTATDVDGSISIRQWTQLSGPNTAVIKTPTTANTMIVGLVAGAYTFQISVTDNGGLTRTATVTINVNAATGTNLPPDADAGPDIIVTLPGTSASLLGSGSDADGSVSSYLWSKISGPSQYTIETPATATTTVENLTLGTYQFQLTVTDDGGSQDIDVTTIVVNQLNQSYILNRGLIFKNL